MLAPFLMDTLILSSLCWLSSKYASLSLAACRKGAAYGVAGVTKGLGISAVNGFGILETIKDALEDKVCSIKPSSLESVSC